MKRFLVTIYNSIEELVIEREFAANSTEEATKKAKRWIKTFDKVNPSQYEICKVVEAQEEKSMFKKFLQEIIDAGSEEELMDIFYRQDGIDMMYQKDKLSWKDHQMLLALINKLSLKQEEEYEEQQN